MKDQTLIGQKIKEARKEAGMSLNELSRRSGLAKSYLSELERGVKRHPTMGVLEDIAIGLDRTLHIKFI